MEVHIFLFDDFDTMDAFGPAEVLGNVPEHFHINYVSIDGKIVNSMQGIKVWTEPLNPETVKGIFIVPGGRGARRLLYQETETLDKLKKSIAHAEICAMVSEGAAMVSQTGHLFRRKIAECKVGENWKRMFLAGVYEVPGASWVADGKYYSASNAFSSLAMTLSILADLTDLDVTEAAAGQIGCAWDAEDETVYR